MDSESSTANNALSVGKVFNITNVGIFASKCKNLMLLVTKNSSINYESGFSKLDIENQLFYELDFPV
jgi:hypothetical protein